MVAVGAARGARKRAAASRPLTRVEHPTDDRGVPRYSLRIALLGASLVCAACQAVFGIDEYAASGGTGGATSTTGGGAAHTTGSGASGGIDTGSGGCMCPGTAPAGWSGTFFLFTTQPSEAFVCPGVEVETTYWEGPPLDEYTCGACDCGVANGAGCSQNPLDCFSAPNCTGAPAGSQLPDNCNGVALPNSCKVAEASLVGGQCAPTGGQPDALSDWQVAHHLCKSSAADDCGGNGCVAAPAGALGVCVLGPANTACPDGWADVSIDAFGGKSDTRGCTPCTCGAPAGKCAGGTYEVTGTPAACGIAPEYSVGECFVGGGKFVNFVGGASVVSATCAPLVTAVPSGVFTPADPATICCAALP